MKKGGVTDYNQFAKEVIAAIPDLSLSFEVFADDFETMEAEARKIATFGDNVFVKIPIMNTKGESAIPLIKKLSAEGININVTALYTVEQVQEVVEAANDEAVTYASVLWRRRSFAMPRRTSSSYGHQPVKSTMSSKRTSWAATLSPAHQMS